VVFGYSTRLMNQPLWSAAMLNSKRLLLHCAILLVHIDTKWMLRTVPHAQIHGKKPLCAIPHVHIDTKGWTGIKKPRQCWQGFLVVYG
jgi:hypothetical protein